MGAVERWQGDAFLQDMSLMLTYDYNQTYPIVLWEDTGLGCSWALYPEKVFTTKTITRCQETWMGMEANRGIISGLRDGHIICKIPF